MKLAIMQPYFFPYLGYFQLIRSVDTFVVYDNVNYIKGGWINRNYILAQGERQLLTLALEGASPNRRINEVGIGSRRRKLLETIRQAYGKAPEFAAVFPLVEDIIGQEESNLARFLDYSLRRICDHLGIAVGWQVASMLDVDGDSRGQDRVLAICERLGASQYINAAGGKALYDKPAFAARGVELSFIESGCTPYRQFENEFIPHLSIIDVLMFNDAAHCACLLEDYKIV